MHPVAPADFHTLASELEAWRLTETARIKAAGLAPEAARSALAALLAKETRLLQTVGRLRVNAAHERRGAAAAAALGAMAAPKTWELRNGAKVGTFAAFGRAWLCLRLAEAVAPSVCSQNLRGPHHRWRRWRCGGLAYGLCR
jgi:hypothetical protein